MLGFLFTPTIWRWLIDSLVLSVLFGSLCSGDQPERLGPDLRRDGRRHQRVGASAAFEGGNVGT